MFDNHFTVIFWCLVISGSCFLIVYIINQIENENKEKVIKKKKLKILDKIYMETYIAGFDDMGAEEGMECWVSKDKFTFFFGALKDKGIDIKIKRITNVFLEDKTFVSQRLTATRILALGIFSLAVPKKKKHKEFCIIIEWEDSNREIQNVVFEFIDNLVARKSLNKIKKYLPLQNKKCPFCAETIKRAAIVCKHCGRDINK